MHFFPTAGTGPSLGLLFLRAVAGAAFLFHGWPKMKNPFGWMPAEAGIPGVLQALAALSEFGGGAAWILGFLTPLASAGIACTMAVATWFHLSRGDPFVAKGGGPAYELALLYLAVAVLLGLSGAGRFSLDALLFARGRPREELRA